MHLTDGFIAIRKQFWLTVILIAVGFTCILSGVMALQFTGIAALLAALTIPLLLTFGRQHAVSEQGPNRHESATMEHERETNSGEFGAARTEPANTEGISYDDSMTRNMEPIINFQKELTHQLEAANFSEQATVALITTSLARFPNLTPEFSQVMSNILEHSTLPPETLDRLDEARRLKPTARSSSAQTRQTA